MLTNSEPLPMATGSRPDRRIGGGAAGAAAEEEVGLALFKGSTPGLGVERRWSVPPPAAARLPSLAGQPSQRSSEELAF
jgi:hypothetical protein